MDAVLSLVLAGLWIYCVVDAVVSDKAAVRTLPKWLWVLVIVLVPGVGAIGWLVLGRPAKPFTGGYEGDTGPIRRSRPASAPRRLRAVRAERGDEVADIEARIEERDRLLARWAEEDRKRPRGPSTPDA